MIKEIKFDTDAELSLKTIRSNLPTQKIDIKNLETLVNTIQGDVNFSLENLNREEFIQVYNVVKILELKRLALPNKIGLYYPGGLNNAYHTIAYNLKTLVREQRQDKQISLEEFERALQNVRENVEKSADNERPIHVYIKNFYEEFIRFSFTGKEIFQLILLIADTFSIDEINEFEQLMRKQYREDKNEN